MKKVRFLVRNYLVGRNLNIEDVKELYPDRNEENALDRLPNIEYHKNIILENIALDN